MNFAREPRSRPRALPWTSALFLLVAFAGFGQSPNAASEGSTATPAPAARPSGSKALADTKARLEVLVASKDFAARLDAAAQQLGAEDAAQLLDFFAPRLPGADRALALAAAGDLWCLLGDFAAAAGDYEASAESGKPEAKTAVLLRASRFWLASGENDRAGRIATLLLSSVRDPVMLDQARVVASWSALFGGSPATARVLASSLLEKAPGTPSSPESAAMQRELRFLLWAASPAAERAVAARSLVDAFPGSPEALIATSSPAVTLSALPHWYLGAFAETPRGSRPEDAAPTPKTTATSAAASPTDKAQVPSKIRYQLGIFSRPDNAEALVAELGRKGFVAHAEKRGVSGREIGRAHV